MIIPAPERPNRNWSMDFVADSTVTGRRFRALTIVDDYCGSVLPLRWKPPWAVTGDNLAILLGMNSESVDLIYLEEIRGSHPAGMIEL